MKRLANLTLILISAIRSGGQPSSYFELFIDYGSLEEGLAAVYSNDTVWATSGSGQMGTGYGTIDAVSNGDTSLIHRMFGKPTWFIGIRDLVRVPAGGLIGSVNFKPTLFSRFAYGLVRFTSTGDTLWSRFYIVDPAFNDICHSLVSTVDSGYAIIGGSKHVDSVGAEIRLIKTDADGNMDWYRDYGLPGSRWENAYDLVQLPDSGYIISGFRDFLNGKRQLLLIRTDKDGSQLWEKTYGGQYKDWGGYVTKSMEGGFMLSGYKSLDPNNDSGRAQIFKVDDSGAMQWSRTYKTPRMLLGSFERVEQLPDSSYVFIGHAIDRDTVCGYNMGWIVKTDRFGNELWNRTYTRNCDNHNYFWDFAPTPDGGFVVCGTTHNATQDAWLLKLDSLGCNAPSCDTVVGVIYVPLPAMQLEVWPNPTDGVVHVRLPVRKVDKIEVVDLMGRVSPLLGRGVGGEAITADMTGLPSGVYVVRIEADGRILQAKVVKR